MIELVKQYRSELVNLCQKFGIAKLDVFGSAAIGNFVPGESDVDFIIEFLVSDPGIADRLYDFAEAAEILLEISVDIVIESGITNPYLRYSIGNSREAIYDANPDRQTAA